MNKERLLEATAKAFVTPRGSDSNPKFPNLMK